MGTSKNGNEIWDSSSKNKQIKPHTPMKKNTSKTKTKPQPTPPKTKPKQSPPSPKNTQSVSKEINWRPDWSGAVNGHLSAAKWQNYPVDYVQCNEIHKQLIL